TPPTPLPAALRPEGALAILLARSGKPDGRASFRMEWLQRLRVKAAADPVDATLVAMRVCGVVALLMIVAVAVWLVVEPLVIGPLPAPPPPPPIPPWFRGEVEPWGLDDYAGAVVALVWTAVAITRFGRSRWG